MGRRQGARPLTFLVEEGRNPVLLDAVKGFRKLDRIAQGDRSMALALLVGGAARGTALVSIEADDGIRFDPESVSAEEIRKEAGYGGVRIDLRAKLDGARIALQVIANALTRVEPRPLADVQLVKRSLVVAGLVVDRATHRPLASRPRRHAGGLDARCGQALARADPRHGHAHRRHGIRAAAVQDRLGVGRGELVFQVRGEAVDLRLFLRLLACLLVRSVRQSSARGRAAESKARACEIFLKPGPNRWRTSGSEPK